MSTLYVQVRDRTRGNVTLPMILWAIAMAAVLFAHEARWGSYSGVWEVGAGVTIALGFYLGWQRRVAAVFVAPVISWMFAWFPLWVAAIIRDGFVKGLFAGFFWITFGWILIAVLEFVGLLLSSSLIRMLRPRDKIDGSSVVIFGPDEQ